MTGDPHIGLDLLYLAPGDTGGMETYARALVPLLPAAWPQARFTVFVGRELAAEWRTRPWHPQIGLVALPVSSSTRIVRTAAQQTVVAGAALRARVDLLHSLGNIAPLAGPRRRVVTIHDLIYRHHPETTTGVLAAGVAALVPAVARRATRIVADSQATAADLAELGGVDPGKVDVVPLGPGAPTGAEPLAEGPLRAALGLGDLPLVLSVSARRPHKNLARLIEAMALVPGAALVLPGYPTPFDDELCAVARRAGVADRVHLCGWIDAVQLEGLYAAARCLAFPSLVEGFGLPVLEAMVRGVPVACSGRSALPEVAGDAALLFDPESVDSIAGAVRQLVGDAALRARLMTRGHAQAARFSWQRTARETVAAQRRALAQ
ncbi:glycosyltransferase family 4 protein [Baekduia soli]|uniref:Glycosyltransferase family 4 protein n=1 Tax=Baekduia soli TaxID=496014 RepID=A0A5B8TZV7_9ACTN|nr:glycosyltransferase family 1 protein [Baekduia soli]QEC46256.1 glycosyltransferase family 4 protein [Baekduia soli]